MGKSRVASVRVICGVGVVLAASAFSACGGDGASPVDGGLTADAATRDGQAQTDAAVSAVFADGTYTWGVWTCGTAARTTDIKAFAISLGIQSVDETIVGSNGTVNSVYAGAPACTRTTAFTLAYPSPGMVTTTTATTFTCSATCAPSKCTAGTQASLVDTFAISTSGNTVTETRGLDAAYIAQVSLQKAAGCQVGDTEIATFTRP